MDRDAWLALAVGLLGAACTILLALGPVVYLFKNGSLGLFTEKVDGEIQFQDRMARRLELKLERDAIASEYGLWDRYTVIPFCGDIRNVLYRNQDFATVERLLAEQWAKVDQHERFQYGRCVGELVDIRAGDDPETLRAVLDAWVAAYPESHRALLARGRFFVEYAWYYRGTGYANTVSRSSWESFEHYLTLAELDLETAHNMAPEDPNASVSMITIAMGRGDHSGVDRYYRRALQADPLNFMARYRRYVASLPQWGGSWEEVDAIVREADQASQAFPILGILRRLVAESSTHRSPEHAAYAESRQSNLDYAEPYKRQLEHNPGHPLLLTNLAYYLAEGNDYPAAERIFRELGDVYYEGTNFEHLVQYNNFRGNTYAAVAFELPRGPERRQRAIEAVEVAPNHYYTNYFCGKELLEDGELDLARKHFELSREADRSYAWSTYRLAEVAEKSGNREEALRMAREVFELNPDEN